MRRIVHEAEGGASGALAGAILGAAAGPPGIVAGAILGGVAGAVAGAVLDSESSKQDAHTRDLDAQIGVSEGDLGAAHFPRRPATIGAHSAHSAAERSPPDAPLAEGPTKPSDA